MEGPISLLVLLMRRSTNHVISLERNFSYAVPVIPLSNACAYSDGYQLSKASGRTCRARL